MIDKRYQRGAGIVLVIFLLSVVTVLGLSLSTISGTSYMSSAYRYQGTQAYFAARAGLDYALARVVGGSGCAGISTNFTIDGYAVVVTCAARGPFTEDIPNYSIYNLTSTASSGGFQAPNATTRRVRASVKNP